MKQLEKRHTIAGQSNKSVAKSQKHDVNLQKNSTLYFQVGLIFCLLGTYSLFEMSFETKIQKPIDIGLIVDEPTMYDVQNYIVEEIVVQEKKIRKKKSKLVSQEPIIVDNNFNEKFIKDLNTPEQQVTNTPIAIPDVVVKKVIEDIPIPFYKIEKAPIYPGCESASNNEERKKCMSSKISRLIGRKFSESLASELGLSGMLRISVEFKIDKTGNVVDIKARAPHAGLEKEAKRVVNKIPSMEPGMQRNKPVDVIYTLPIIFQVKD